MDRKTFEIELRRDGYDGIEEKVFPPGHRPGHAHDFDLRGLVLDGAITLDDGNSRQTYGLGEMFAMPAHVSHSEDIGAAGCTVVIGRRR